MEKKRRVSRTEHALGDWGTEAEGKTPKLGQVFVTVEKHLRLLQSAAADL